MWYCYILFPNLTIKNYHLLPPLDESLIFKVVVLLTEKLYNVMIMGETYHHQRVYLLTSNIFHYIITMEKVLEHCYCCQRIYYE